MTPDEWAALNRIYPKTTAVPGPRDPGITPYVIAIERSIQRAEHRRIVAVFGTQMGKALDLDTPLATPGGWTTMGEIQPGDRLFDERGEPCLVTAVSEVMVGRSCFRVEFCDGSWIVADANHLWTVGEAVRVRGKIERLSRTLTTEEMVEVGISRSTGAARFSILLTAPIRVERNALPFDPYILGAWLGDGTSANASITVGDQDLHEITAMVEACGAGVVARPSGTANRLSIFALDGAGVHVGRRAPENMQKALRSIGVLRNKHIPISYLRASEEDRWSLLRGLMDTDGSASGTACEFGVKSDALASGMVELLCSLGFRPRRSMKTLADGYVVHIVRFYAYRDQPVFGLTRKQEALPIEGAMSRRHLNRQRYIRSIVPVDSRPVKCVQVSSASRLYLAGERMVPTHNSELILDVIGHRLDSRPVPMAYIMPSDKLLKDVVEPRMSELLKTESLQIKTTRKKQKKDRKEVAGTVIRLVTAGSASDLSADSLGLIFTDEVDKFLSNVKGQGNAVGLADRRGDAYDDFVHFSTSSPTVGPADIEVDEASGLEFWSHVDKDDLRSPIWGMWQSGTRYHWAWPCPHCDTYFIPRFRRLEWDKPKDKDGKELPSTPIMAKRTAHIVCEECHCVLTDDDKDAMNARGVFVAPGQSVDPDGTVVGDAPDAWTDSYWVSGLASPFVPWGNRAAAYIEAARSGDMDAVQAEINGMGELFAPGDGDAPDFAELMALRDPDYLLGEIPKWVRMLTLTVDVQKEGVYVVMRGWGAAARSCLVQARYLFGETEKQKVWDDLGEVLTGIYGGIPISMALVDSGYRPGKKFTVPTNMVYKFCRKYRNLAFATKGASNPMLKPILASKLDVTIDGKPYKNGVDLRVLDTGFFKRWLQFKIRTDVDSPDAWRLPGDIDDDYLTQMTSEVEVKLPNGKTKWVARSKNNHYFDCEAMQGAIEMMLNLKLLHQGPPIARRASQAYRHRPAGTAEAELAAPASGQPAASPRKKRGRSADSIW